MRACVRARVRARVRINKVVGSGEIALKCAHKSLCIQQFVVVH